MDRWTGKGGTRRRRRLPGRLDLREGARSAARGQAAAHAEKVVRMGG